MKTLDLSPNSTEIVSPEHFLQILADEPGNIAYAEVIPGRLGDLDGLILIRRKRPVHSLRGRYGRSSSPRRTDFFSEFGRIIGSLA
jgi:hypothetical protein